MGEAEAFSKASDSASPAPPSAGAFAYHRGATIRLALMVLPIYIPVEVLVVDSLVVNRRWVQLLHAAGWLAILLLIAALYLSMGRRPHRVSAAGLELYRGFLSQVKVPAELVVSVELLPEPADGIAEVERLPPGVTSMTVRGVPEVELKLDAPVRPTSVTGPRPETRILRISVNDRSAFQAAVLSARNEARRDRGLL